MNPGAYACAMTEIESHAADMITVTYEGTDADQLWPIPADACWTTYTKTETEIREAASWMFHANFYENLRPVSVECSADQAAALARIMPAPAFAQWKIIEAGA